MQTRTAGQYYGLKRSAVELAGVAFSEYDYTAARTDWHYHERPYFMYVVEGEVWDISKGQRRRCTPGTLQLHNWREPHYNALASRRARGFHVELPEDWVSQRASGMHLREGSLQIEDPRLHCLLGQLYAEFKHADTFSAASVELLLMGFCESGIAAPPQRRKEPMWVGTLRQILRDGSPTLSLSALSAELGVHPVHISRSVPRYFGCSLGDYSRQLRVRRALDLLLDERYTLTEIANVCDFTDASHFSRTFRRYMKVAPSTYRKRLRE